MRTINQAGLDLLEKAEGYSSTPYYDQGGKLTIGIGHTGDDVHPDGWITHDQALILLRHDLEAAARSVQELTVCPLTDNQLSALVSFVFNVGAFAFSTSTMRRKLNKLDYAGAAEEFLRWTHIKGVTIRGLEARRAAERALFLSKN